jgi:TolB-like protein
MAGLADKIGRALATKGCKNVAALDFTDIQGQPTELGRFLSEQLTVEIVATASVAMVDRANLKSILAEHKLTEEGLVNPANAKKLGEFAGVDAILIGNATVLDDGVVLMVKAISTASAQIVAAGRIKFPKTSEIQQLFNRSVSGSAGGSSPAAVSTAGGGGNSYQDAGAVATKDIGSLRVALKSAMAMKVTRSGRHTSGIRCTFELINRETQRQVVVAVNAEREINYFPFISANQSREEMLKASLLDERGVVWNVVGSGMTGLPTIRAGNGPGGRPYLSTEIVRLLDKRDRLNSDREPASADQPSCCGTVEFIYGATTPIEPGRSLKVTMDFIASEADVPAPQFIQISGEIVVGIVMEGGKKSYSLQNLLFDRVSVSSY